MSIKGFKTDKMIIMFVLLIVLLVILAWWIADRLIEHIDHHMPGL
ncbi:MAG: hypothetical protein SH808_02790 [Saprospiraceae bacterium]|nr:hypothetical protein [Saprospiraceae bacterium]